MSEIYFVFSDESGDYKKHPGKKFLRANPYYIRAAYITKAKEWHKMRSEMIRLKKRYNLPLYDELKWSDIWEKYKQGENISNLIKFIRESMQILHSLSYCKIIYTVTFNKNIQTIEEKDIKKWHIQDIMQRIQMEIQTDNENLAILFFDPPDDGRDLKYFQTVYREIFLNDRFIENYGNLKDTINFEPSHHSVGIQLADYLAGCFRGFLCGYPESFEIFKEIVYPLIRRGQDGEITGYGIIEIPKDDNIRRRIKDKLTEV